MMLHKVSLALGANEDTKDECSFVQQIQYSKEEK